MQLKLYLARSGNCDKSQVPSRELAYVMYAREFGWTPAQVDEIPLTLEPWLMPIHAAIEQSLADSQPQPEQAHSKGRRR